MHPLVHSNGMGSNIPSFGYLIGSLTFIPMGLTGGLRPLQNSIVSGQWNKIGLMIPNLTYGCCVGCMY